MDNSDLIGRYLIEARHAHERSLGIVCPGCREVHYLRIEQDGTHEKPLPQWSWNGDVDAPVFTPSFLVQGCRYPKGAQPGDADDLEWDRLQQQGADAMFASRFGTRCHLFIGCNGAQPGMIVFLNDCRHDMRGKVAPLVDVAQWRDERARDRAARLRAQLEGNTPAFKKPAPGAGSWRPLR
jgi:hypothetical protein